MLKFSSKYTCGEVECNFVEPADFFFQRTKHFLTHHPKTKKKNFFNFFPNDSSVHLQGGSDRVAPK